MKFLGSWAIRCRTGAALGARRLAPAMAVTALAAGSLAAGAVPGPAAASAARTAAKTSSPPKDETTVSQNKLRDGWDPNEPALTPAAVSGGSFGQVFSTSVNGQVYGQPLIVGSTLIVATENDWVYGLNARTGAVLWKTSLGTPYHITSCQDLVPNIGVTSAPVYDPSTGTVYVMGLVHEISLEWHLFGLNVNTGAITFKKRIAGHPANDSHLTFDPITELQRTGLLLMNGWVYASFGSHCDHGSYTGYVAGVQPSTAKTTLWTTEADITDDKGGVWQSGGGIMSDGSGRIFVTSSNGISPARGPGNKPPGQLGDSVIRLQPQADGSLKPMDFFSPRNAPELDAANIDFGSGGPTGLPFGTSTYPHVLMQSGKDGRIFLLNRDSLGGRKQGPGRTDADLAEAGPYGPQFGHPALFANTRTLTSSNAGSASDYMVFVGANDYMREFKFGVGSGGEPTLSDVANSSFILGFTSGAPAITSNGTNPSSGLVWEVHNADQTGTNAWLGAWALLPQPRSGGGTKLSEIWAAPIGTASRYSVVATGNGMVYVGTRDGKVLGFGLKSGAALTSGGAAQFRGTPLGSKAGEQVSVTAAKTVTVTGASVSSPSAPAPFTLGRVSVSRHGGKPATVTFPVTLHEGDVLHAAVKFAPATVGGAEGAVSFTTGTGSSLPVSVPLIGDGTSTGLFATAPSLSFVIAEDGGVTTNVPVGITKPLVTDIVNGGTRPVTVTSVKLPAGRYRVVHLPEVGTVIKPGEALPVEIIFAPQQAVTSNGSLTVTASSGTSATVTLTGTGLPPVSKFTASPSTVDFGAVRVGHTATVMIHIRNAGNQPSLMRSSAPTSGPFGAPARVTNGLPVNGEDDLVLPVTFHPAKAGTFHGVYKVTWTDEFGQHSLNVPITGTGV